jgi:hypothetical protein
VNFVPTSNLSSNLSDFSFDIFGFRVSFGSIILPTSSCAQGAILSHE